MLDDHNALKETLDQQDCCTRGTEHEEERKQNSEYGNYFNSSFNTWIQEEENFLLNKLLI